MPWFHATLGYEYWYASWPLGVSGLGLMGFRGLGSRALGLRGLGFRVYSGLGCPWGIALYKWGFVVRVPHFLRLPPCQLPERPLL